MKRHWLWMVIGCGLPLLFIFLAPALGINGTYSLLTFIVLMFAVHLMIPMDHKGHTHGLSDDNLHRNTDDEKGPDHGHAHH